MDTNLSEKAKLARRQLIRDTKVSFIKPILSLSKDEYHTGTIRINEELAKLTTYKVNDVILFLIIGRTMVSQAKVVDLFEKKEGLTNYLSQVEVIDYEVDSFKELLVPAEKTTEEPTVDVKEEDLTKYFLDRLLECVQELEDEIEEPKDKQQGSLDEISWDSILIMPSNLNDLSSEARAFNVELGEISDLKISKKEDVLQLESINKFIAKIKKELNGSNNARDKSTLTLRHPALPHMLVKEHMPASDREKEHIEKYNDVFGTENDVNSGDHFRNMVFATSCETHDISYSQAYNIIILHNTQTQELIATLPVEELNSPEDVLVYVFSHDSLKYMSIVEFKKLKGYDRFTGELHAVLKNERPTDDTVEKEFKYYELARAEFSSVVKHIPENKVTYGTINITRELASLTKHNEGDIILFIVVDNKIVSEAKVVDLFLDMQSYTYTLSISTIKPYNEEMYKSLISIKDKGCGTHGPVESTIVVDERLEIKPRGFINVCDAISKEQRIVKRGSVNREDCFYVEDTFGSIITYSVISKGYTDSGIGYIEANYIENVQIQDLPIKDDGLREAYHKFEEQVDVLYEENGLDKILDSFEQNLEAYRREPKFVTEEAFVPDNKLKSDVPECFLDAINWNTVEEYKKDLDFNDILLEKKEDVPFRVHLSIENTPWNLDQIMISIAKLTLVTGMVGIKEVPKEPEIDSLLKNYLIDVNEDSLNIMFDKSDRPRIRIIIKIIDRESESKKWTSSYLDVFEIGSYILRVREDVYDVYDSKDVKVAEITSDITNETTNTGLYRKIITNV